MALAQDQITVFVDGITITGNGSSGSPLTAAGGGGGYPIISKTVAQMQALVGSFNVNARYLITDAYGGKMAFLVCVYNVSTLCASGTGLYQNAVMTTPVVVEADYNLAADKIQRLYEPIGNNLVKCSTFFTALDVFKFDDNGFQIDNTFDNVEMLNFTSSTIPKHVLFDGSIIHDALMDGGNTDNAYFHNFWYNGVNNGLSGFRIDIALTGNEVFWGCNGAYGNDDATQLDGMGLLTDCEYNQIGWLAQVNLQGFNHVTMLDNSIANYAILSIGASNIHVERNAFISPCTINIVGSSFDNVIGGLSAISRFSGSNNNLFGITKNGGANAVQMDNNQLDGVTILNEGTGCSVQGCFAKGSTIDFAGHNNCTLSGMNITTSTITFTTNGQTISNEIWVNNVGEGNVKIPFTFSQVRTGSTIPLVAVPARGANYIIQVISAFGALIFNSVAYDLGQEVIISTRSSWLTLLGQFNIQNFVSSTQTTYEPALPSGEQNSIMPNEDLLVGMDTDSTVGNSPINIYIKYQIRPL